MTTYPVLPSLGKRLGARLVDGLIPLPLVVAGEMVALFVDGTVGLLVGSLLLLSGVGVATFNQVIRVGRRGQSWGRQVLGVVVLDQETGRPLGVGRAFVREAVHGVLFAACVVPGIVNLVVTARNARRQGWHDTAARSLAVAARVGANQAAAPVAVRPPMPGGAAVAPPAAPSSHTQPAGRMAPGATPRPAPPTVSPVPGLTATPPAQQDNAAPSSVESPPAMVGPPPGMIGPPPGMEPPAPEPPAPEPPAPEPPAPEPPGPAPEVDDSAPVTTGVGPDQRHGQWRLATPTGATTVVDGLVLVGRDPDPSLVAGARRWVLDDPEFTVSKTHALLGLENGTAWVEDWNSTNGVALCRGVAELVLEPRARTPLREGDVIEFGSYKVTVTGPQPTRTTT